jgi:excinuclease ABC subunit A
VSESIPSQPADAASSGAARGSQETLSAAPADRLGETIRIRGARAHNLRNVDVDIPRDRLVVITGPSGSGKSSLAFDTLFAEGQRQYIESLSTYARQFVNQMERPDVDLIDGLQPTISIDQRAGSQNPRSTVATVTEIYDHLRLLMARLGQPHCPNCGSAICQQSPEEIVDRLAASAVGTKVILLAPLVRGRKGEHRDVFAAIRKAGFVRARVDGVVVDVDQAPELAPRKNHHIEAVVDRIVIREGVRPRLAESVDMALSHGEGAILVSELAPGAAANNAQADWRESLYSTLNACPNCKSSFQDLEPRSFSFNSPYGACPKCDGLGVLAQFDSELVLPDESLSLTAGAVAPWRGSVRRQERHAEQIEQLLAAAGVDADTPLADYKPKGRQLLWNGDEKHQGLLTLLEKDYATATKPEDRERLETFRDVLACPDCGGARLRPEARACRFHGKPLHEITALAVSAAREFFAQVSFAPHDEPIGAPIVSELLKRLEFLERVGVDYLTLDRPADTLSGGELQRVRLATGIGSGLVGVCYVLDEPSIGLHPRDNQRLIDALRDLQGQGNTVLVVEHDEAMMRQADRLIDMGPGAGLHGGQIVAEGTPDEVAADPRSLTGGYLAGRLNVAPPRERRRTSKTHSLTIEGVTTNNLKDVEARIPLSALVCVTGVSGSGKSSLVNETLSRALARRLGMLAPKPGPHRSLRGVAQIDKLIEIDQSPIGRNPRSNPATYVGVFDEIRKVFAGTREARQLGYSASRFSFNAKGGRCEECQGQGVSRIEMNFLPDLVVTCPTCGGARFNRQTLQVRYRDKNIADVLAMRIDEGVAFFENFPAIVRALRSLQQVGVGYLTLGQSATTLSGGEAQRIKLGAELARVDTGKTLYILDEPTTGLHFDDVRNLLAVLNRLVDLGNTVLVIEHNLDVIKAADWLIDLGPEGGAAGGYLLASGTPEEIAALADNSTGKFLQSLLTSSSE